MLAYLVCGSLTIALSFFMFNDLWSILLKNHKEKRPDSAFVEITVLIGLFWPFVLVFIIGCVFFYTIPIAVLNRFNNKK